MRYFIATLDDRMEDQWGPGHMRTAAGQPLDGLEAFTRGHPYSGELPLVAEQAQTGLIPEWSWTTEMIPLGGATLVQLLRRTCPEDVQILPVRVDSSDQETWVLNITRVKDCIDESRSVIRRLPEHSSQRPLRSYIAVEPLTIDPRRASGAHVLRVQGWLSPVVVSEHLKDEITGAAMRGVRFLEA